MIEWLQDITLILMLFVAVKAITGYHWPWEVCQCCKKRYSEHKEQ